MKRAYLILLLTALLTPDSTAQSTIHDWYGASHYEHMGESASSAGDVNGDAVPDIVVRLRVGPSNSHVTRVYSGSDGSILHDLTNIGYPCTGAGDVNADGFDDLIGSDPSGPTPSSGQGAVVVVSGKDGSVLYSWQGDGSFDYFGNSVSGAGDVNGDGFADVIVGAPQNMNSFYGYVRVFSGSDGSLLHQWLGDWLGQGLGLDSLGWSVSDAGDVDKDGYADVIAGAPYSDINGTYAGSVRVFSGFTGSVLYTWHGDSAGDRFGDCVSGAGDINGDGFSDLLVGAPGDDNNGTASGSVRMFSGFDGKIIKVAGYLNQLDGDSAGDDFGDSVSGAGDVNNDGYADVIVGAKFDDNTGYDSGSARVFSGSPPKFGQTLHTFNGENSGDFFGEFVDGVGDVNGDGLDDVVVGAVWANSPSSDDCGRMAVLTLASPFPDCNGNGAPDSDDINSGLSSDSNQNGVPDECEQVLYKWYGDSAKEFFGTSVSGAGDVNGDGYADLIVGAPSESFNGTLDGSASVMSGRDGSVLYKWIGDADHDQLGVNVSGAGDVNADGYADLIVGARQNVPTQKHGYARVYSGVDGSILYTWYGDQFADQFNHVSGAGDVNADGHDDLVVGAWGNGSPGYVKVFSGKNGSILYTWNGESDGYSLCQVSDAGDVNADGYDDVIVGDPQSMDRPGYARVHSGFDGSVLYKWDGDSTNDCFGGSVSGAGDVNGDGHADLIVGARKDDDNGFDSGSARVFSGFDGSILYTWYGGPGKDNFGWSVSGAGDVNVDGFADLIVGAPQGLWGTAHVFSGMNGSEIHSWQGEAVGSDFGNSVGDGGDVNGDGYPDLIVGEWLSTGGGTNSGSASVLSLYFDDCNGNSILDVDDIANGTSQDCNANGIPDECESCPCNANAIYSYGSGCPGTGGVEPTLFMHGCPMASGQVGFEISHGLPGSVAILLIGLQEAAIPMPDLCMLNITQIIPFSLVLPLDGQGSFSALNTYPPSIQPAILKLQVFCVDPGNSLGFSTTRGVSLTIK